MCSAKYWAFLRKRMNTNPKKGPFHERAPSKMVARVIRGMLPHTTQRGTLAYKRLTTYVLPPSPSPQSPSPSLLICCSFEGVPSKYNTVKRVVVPDALRVMRLKPQRKYAVLGRMAQDMGWKHKALIEKLEGVRKESSGAWFAKKTEMTKLRAQAFEDFAKKNAEAAKLIANAGRV